MKYVFFLSGENVKIAEAEVLSLAKCYGEIISWELDERVLTLDFNGENFFERLAFSHEVSELFSICSFSEIEKEFSKMNIDGTCCVRATGIGIKVNENVERKLGEILWKKGARIKLENPKNLIRVYLTPKRCYIGFLVFRQKKKQFLEREPNKRPFFMPIVTLPKFSRALVNLAAIKSGKILDPMCGTGSFLIEAGLMKLEIFGMDYYRDIVYGCRENLEFYGLEGELVQGDVRSMPFKEDSFEAIVTDYPYFKATRKGSEEDLYEKSLQEISRVLKKKKRAVIVTNQEIADFPL
ncbi:MAG: methyltransferase domain-containing protein, partial [Archaeoglobaceae archaeon]